MEIKTNTRHLRISPKKLRFIIDDIKNVRPVDALNILLYSPKKGAKILLKAIKSAIDNAKNNYKIDENSLSFKFLSVDAGRFLKRFRPAGRGTTKPFKKRTSHITVVLTTKSVSKNKNKSELKINPPTGKKK